MIPKVIIKYSWIYDDKYRESGRIKEMLKEQNKKYPSRKKLINYTLAVSKLWKKDEKDILKEISKILNLGWMEKEIKCYIIGVGRSFSDPITIKLHKNKNDFVDLLTHELIHNLCMQNYPKYRKWREFAFKKYKTKESSFVGHIILHAVHHKIYLKLFNKKRLNKDLIR